MASELVRWTWSCYPASKVDATRLVVPLACLVTPLKAGKVPVLSYAPVQCQTCHGVLSPLCQVDYRARLFACALCGARTALPPHYADITPSNMPAELIPEHSTVEYRVGAAAAAAAAASPTSPGGAPSTPGMAPRATAPPPAVVFVLDVAQDMADLDAMRDVVTHVINSLSDTTMVGIVTFGAAVHVHEVTADADTPRAHVLRGSAASTSQSVRQLLGPGARSCFLAPLKDVDITVSAIVSALRTDPFPAPKGLRRLRCTGAAISVAAGLLDALLAGYGGRILLMTGGPCTLGPGMTVSTSLADPIRSHIDVRTETAPHWKASCAYYTGTVLPALLASRHALDAVGGSLDQVGVAEMAAAVQQSGGVILLADQWDRPYLRSTLAKLYGRVEAGGVGFGLCASVDVHCTRDTKVLGCVGPVSSAAKKTACVAEAEVGVGGTSSWRTGVLTADTTLAFFFDVCVPPPGTATLPGTRVVQFITRFQHPDGEWRWRVTTATHVSTDTPPPTDGAQLAPVFDEFTAATVLARVAVHRASSEEHLYDVLRWLDRTLIHFTRRVSSFQADVPASLRLPAGFTHLPQLLFHLRRGELMHVFNSSPDETAMWRGWFVRATPDDSSFILRPALTAYAMDGTVAPVPLDAASIRPDVILLLDTYFELVVHYGSTVASWRDQGYAQMPEYAYFAKVMLAPDADVRKTAADRVPTPRIVTCDQGSSPARLLLSRVNPSMTHLPAAGAGGGDRAYGQTSGEIVFTEDTSLSMFLDHLKKLVVSAA